MDDDVLVVTHPLAPASEGHVESLLDIISTLASVTLVTANLRDGSEIRDKFDVIDISRADTGDSILVAAFRFVLNQLRMCRIIAGRDEETVLFFGATSYLLPITTARILGRTVVLEPRGDVPLSLYLQWRQKIPGPASYGLAGVVWILERTCYRLAHGIVTYTPAMADQLGLDAYRHKLYPQGARYVDLDEFSPKTPFQERDRAVGFLGRIDEEKGIRTLAEVTSRLSSETTFRFLGDGDLREWLETELAEEIETGRVEITGWVDHDDVPAELNELRLIVVPSEPTEGLPTVILESMACGTPVYATGVSGVPDVVREGETGFLMTEEGAGEVARRLEEILNRDDLSEVSRNCRQLMETEYSFPAAVERYRDIFSDLRTRY